jgi:ectoine hydroxylase-related dioxygenase (phytanoyl-CoA dioxygenase family)
MEGLRNSIDKALVESKQNRFVFEGAQKGKFHGTQDLWRRDDACGKYCTTSALPGIASRLLRSSKVNLFFDHLFVKEPNTKIETSWHNDLPYYPIEGSQIVSFWLALDPVNNESGALEFVAGSHRWGQHLQPVSFAVESEAESRRHKSEIENFDPDSQRHVKISFNLDPGDVLAFHGLAVHRAGGNLSSQRRRGYTVRYTGDDVRYAPRAGIHKMMLVAAKNAGDVLDCDRFPVVWNSVSGVTAA